jgi:Ribbon-helix-helix protein, copG family.
MWHNAPESVGITVMGWHLLLRVLHNTIELPNVTVRMDEDTRDALDEEADNRGLNRSEYIR